MYDFKIDLPVKISFSMFGDDKDNDLEKAKFKLYF